MLSTRENGILPPFFPSINKLNYVIAYAKVDNVEYLLDATDEYSTINLLPERCINQKGFIMSKDRSAMISLDPTKKSIQAQMITLDMDVSGKLTGKVDASYTDYAAFNFRHNYASYNSTDEFIDGMFENDPNIFVDNYTINNLDNLENPVKESYSIELKNQLQTIGDKMYLTPLLHYKTTDNPFKNEERKYPVSYPYCKQKKVLVNINLPEGYKVSELPQPLVMSLPNNAGKITYQVQYQNGKLTALYHFFINKTTFTTEEYALLREFYNQVVKKHAEPVVIEKI